MNFFPKIKRWRISPKLLQASVEEMAVDGREGNEGTVFWLGQRMNSEAIASHLVVLRGGGVIKHPYNVQVKPELMRQVHDEAMARGLVLIAQIHSHSPECGVDMSETDHECGISVPYFLSVICPAFALNPTTTIADCGVHVCKPGVGYVRLTSKQVAKAILQNLTDPTWIITAGEK